RRRTRAARRGARSEASPRARSPRGSPGGDGRTSAGDGGAPPACRARPGRRCPPASVSTSRPEDNPSMPGTLYLVGTPIGNLSDVSERARRTLADVAVIAAEDTRRTGRLLASLDIESGGRLVSFFDANEDARIPRLLERLRSGDDVAVVSDGGMPAIADPGYRLVRACVQAGITVDVVPGPSAGAAAVGISGLPTG